MNTCVNCSKSLDYVAVVVVHSDKPDRFCCNECGGDEDVMGPFPLWGCLALAAPPALVFVFILWSLGLVT